MDIVLMTNTDNPSFEFRNGERFGDDSGFRVDLWVRSSGLSFELPFYFEKYSLEQFIIGITEMNQTLKGNAVLKPLYEPNIVEFEMNNVGGLWVRGEMTEYTSKLQKVNFEFKTDQSCLAPFLKDLSSFMESTTLALN